MDHTVAPPTHLKLKAETVEDLTIMSTVLQDAVTIVGDMAYQSGERRFALMLNRYLWELDTDLPAPDADAKAKCQRIRCGLHFNDVLKVAARDIPQKSRQKALELLAIHGETGPDGSGAILLFFAGGGALRLEVECIDGYLADVGSPWEAKCRPSHSP